MVRQPPILIHPSILPPLSIKGKLMDCVRGLALRWWPKALDALQIYGILGRALEVFLGENHGEGSVRILSLGFLEHGCSRKISLSTCVLWW